MTDKVQKIREIIDNMQNLTMDKNGNFTSDYNQGKYDALCEVDTLLQELLVDSLQEEHVSIWHDPSEKPNIKEKSGIFVITSLNGEYIGSRYYNYNDITINFGNYDKWAYLNDLLNLSNVERTVKDRKEMPVSEDLEKAAVEAFKKIVDSDKNNFLEIFKAGYKYGKEQAEIQIQAQSMALAHGCPKENTNNELKVAADNALESITDQYDIISVGSCLEMFRLGAEWQKAQEYTCYEEAFEDGAKWKVENLWKPVDGDDLPEIDREVIVLLNSGKVVFAHRPPEFWDGKNIETGKVTRYYPKTYDKGGWNIPDVKYWLDIKIPNE